MSSPHNRPTASTPSLDGPIPALFCGAGAVLAVVGALPWLAALTGHDAATGWAIRVIGVLAFAVGLFVALVGVGLFRARNGMRAAAVEGELDAALVAAAASATASANTHAHGGAADGAVGHDPCATDTACASCDATCALSALR